MYKSLRKIFVKFNDFFGRLSGYKIRRDTYSRPSTIKAKEIFGDKPIKVIEIGCASGNNALDVLENLNVAEYIIIDPYEKILVDYDDYDHERLILMRKQAKERLARYSNNIKWIYDFSDDAADKITGKYDFIYIDGNHNYEYVLSDMNNYFKFLSDNFVFGGHDIDQPGVSRAFVEFLASTDQYKTYDIKDPDWLIYKG
jgi:hypothetical protein